MLVTGTHDPYLVVLSILVASFASYTALDLGAHAGVARGLARRVWLVAAAITMGSGIWSMHFVGMLAFIMPMSMSYDIGLTIVSLVVAIVVTSGGFYILSRQSASPLRLGVSGVFMGLGIVAMHYTGMAAMRAHADLTYDRLAVAWIASLYEQRRTEEALLQARADLAHVNRVTTLGELTASLAHEVNQPIAAAISNAHACLNWLAGETPNLTEARASAMSIVEDGTRAADIISRIRLLFKKVSPQRGPVDVNDVIREMNLLLRSELARYSISARTELAEHLPRVMGDRVHLQQVMMNLIVNGIDAMKDVEGTRELAVKSQRVGREELMVCVSDTGVGLPPRQADQIFYAVFTTKPHGTGMGLSISRTIVESHGGRLWAADNSPRGATFHVVLPTTALSSVDHSSYPTSST